MADVNFALENMQCSIQEDNTGADECNRSALKQIMRLMLHHNCSPLLNCGGDNLHLNPRLRKIFTPFTITV
jgi:hypothetical protein